MRMISVIMPVYNAEKYVAQAIESILNQTYSNLEFLIVDDGSTDNSLRIISEFSEENDRIRLWAQLDGNQGCTKQLNRLLNWCRSEWIARMDADDVAKPDRLTKQLDFLVNNREYVAVGGKVEVIDATGNIITNWCEKQTHPEIEATMLNPVNTGETVVCHPAVMYRRSAVLAVNKYDEAVVQSQDLDLFLRLMEKGGKLANLPDVLLQYRLHLESSCHTHFQQMWDSGQKSVKASRQRRGLPELPYVLANPSYLLSNMTIANG